MSAGAERIIRHILDDAESKAAEIRDAAAMKSREIEEQAQKEARRRQDQILQQARSEGAERKRRIFGAARLDARKQKLAAKQELIAEAFRRSLEMLCSLDEAGYSAVMRSMLLAAAETGEEKVILSAGDRDRLPDSFWQDLNAALVKAGKKGDLTPADETRKIQGGFILQSGGVEINCSFEALLEAQREELEPEVAGILFA